MANDKREITNEELFVILEAMKRKDDSIIVLRPEEIDQIRQFMKIISVDDLKYIKEYTEDRKAVSRVFSKWKSFLFAVAAVILAYITVVGKGVPIMRDLMSKFLTLPPPGA